jgi:hypothetical protein
MVSTAPRLGQVEPRERAGAQTGRKYEYQYERTARAALDLLTDSEQYICVYCDWHDDYVVEVGAPHTRYVFHQVKGRKSSQGPWTFSEFFGVLMKKAPKPSKKAASVRLDAVAPRMVLHHQNFREHCAGVAFVTNAGLDPGLSAFLNAFATSHQPSELPADVRVAFEHLARAYVAADPPLAASADAVFSWLRALSVRTDQGHLENGEAALLELAGVVVEYSEIDLRLLQAKQIAREIVSRVRTKVGHCTTIVPAADDQLRKDKGIVVAELLKELSLSPDAYEELKAGAAPDAVKTLSRLQRYCLKNGLDEGALIAICGFKAQWDIWRTIERHFLKSVDYVLLEDKANSILKAGLSLPQIVAEAKAIAKQFHGIPATQLTAEHVLGLVFALAAQSEGPGGRGAVGEA